MNIPSIQDIFKAHPPADEIEKNVKAAISKIEIWMGSRPGYETGFKPMPLPGDVYTLDTSEFMERTGVSMALQEAVIDRVSKTMKSLGYSVRTWKKEHRTIWGNIYDTEPAITITVPIQ